jgi:hypothetical protein
MFAESINIGGDTTENPMLGDIGGTSDIGGILEDSGAGNTIGIRIKNALQTQISLESITQTFYLGPGLFQYASENELHSRISAAASICLTQLFVFSELSINVTNVANTNIISQLYSKKSKHIF